MAQVITAFAKQSWSNGTREWEGAVPTAVEAVRLTLDRSSFSGAEGGEALHLDWWLSQDNGASWQYMGGAGFTNGVAVVKGVTRATSSLERDVPGVGNARRRARVSYRVNVASNTSVEVTLLP